MRTAIAITITITTATAPPMIASVLTELELAGVAAASGLAGAKT